MTSDHMTKDRITQVLHLRIQRTEEELQRARVMGLHSVIAQLQGKQQAYREVLSLLDGSTGIAQLSYYEGFKEVM